MQIARGFFLAAADAFPFADMLDHKLITKEDTINFTIFEMISMAFIESLKQIKSIRSFLMRFKTRGNVHTVDAIVRKMQRTHQYAQKYKLNQHDRILRERGREILELEHQGKQVERGAGYRLKEMNLYEIHNLQELAIMEKIVNKQICDSEKVSDEKFRMLMEEYEKEVTHLQGSMKDSRSIVFNTLAFFNLEWLYNIDIIYRIAMEAESRHIDHLDALRLVSILGERAILRVPDKSHLMYNQLFDDVTALFIKNGKSPMEAISEITAFKKELTLEPDNYLFTYNRMLHIRNRFIPELFDDKPDLQFHKAYDFHLYLNDWLWTCDVTSRIYNYVKQQDIEDWAEFIQEYFWIWDTRPGKKDWTPNRIRLARELYNEIIIDDEGRHYIQNR